MDVFGLGSVDACVRESVDGVIGKWERGFYLYYLYSIEG